MDSAIRPSGERGAVPTDARGVTPLGERLQALPPTLLVLAAPGGLERAATAAVAPAGLPGVVVPPRQVRDGARATGQGATPDAVDARALAHVAAVIRPTPRPVPDAQPQELRALLGRRQHLVARRPAAHNRLTGMSARLRTDMTAHIPWRNERRARRDDALDTVLRSSPLGRDNADLVQRAPGVGPGWARTVFLAWPEVGTLTGQQLATWVGVAPLHGASGTWRGRRTIWGGRARGRAGFSMAPRVATRDNPRSTACDERLLAAGTGKQVAVTACRHKVLTILNARLPQRMPWPSQDVQGYKKIPGPLDNQDSCSAPLRLSAAPDA